MNMILSRIFERYIAVDLHRAYVVVGGVNARQEVVLAPRRIELEAWPRWAKAHLEPVMNFKGNRPYAEQNDEA